MKDRLKAMLAEAKAMAPGAEVIDGTYGGSRTADLVAMELKGVVDHLENAIAFLDEDGD